MELHLKELRRLRGLSQDDMAQILGVKKSRYGTWERGERMLSASQLCACADALDCSTDAILGRKVKTTYSDPRQAELNRIWEGSEDRSKETIIDVARMSEGRSEVSKRQSEPGTTPTVPGEMKSA